MTKENVSTKICSKCKVEKESADYYTNKTGKFCKLCISHINKLKRRKKNIKKDIIDYEKAVNDGLICTKCNKLVPLNRLIKDMTLKFNVKKVCLPCNSKTSREFYNNNVDKCIERTKKWRGENKEHRAEYEKAYSAKNAERKKASQRERYKRNPLPLIQKVKERADAEKLATPIWANKDYISLWYKLAKIEQERTGMKIHVDHIIPLISDVVCGLHCEDNFQLLTAGDNIRKGRKFNSDGSCYAKD